MKKEVIISTFIIEFEEETKISFPDALKAQFVEGSNRGSDKSRRVSSLKSWSLSSPDEPCESFSWVPLEDTRMM